MNYKAILQLIADILNFEYPNEDLENQLKASDIAWEKLVQIASSHGVLTTVYCRLHQKKLTNLLPEDLLAYLEQLTNINRNRNTTLIKEAKWIAKLLNSHNIEYVFFKGMGILLAGHYKDPGERLIGDIDILVKTHDLEKAFKLINSNGYNKQKGFDYDVKDFRHLPRQINTERLAAIELHDNILIKNKRHLLDLNAVFETAETIENLKITNSYYNNLINTLTTQINNHNYFYNRIIFKNLYDSMVLKLEKEDFTTSKSAKNNYFEAYLGLFRYWIRQNAKNNQSFFMRWRLKMYRNKISNKRLESLVFIGKYTFVNLLKRAHLILFNGSYRRHILKKKIFVKS